VHRPLRVAQVLLADDGAGCLKAVGDDVAGSELPDVILLDAMMPNMTGFEVSSARKRNGGGQRGTTLTIVYTGLCCSLLAS
jgi:CheY-like chemotaxis protein